MSAREQVINLGSAPTVTEGNEEALKGSQPQQGRCECAKGCIECEMESRMRKFRSEILRSLSPGEIMPRMCSCNLLDFHAAAEFFLDDTIPRVKKAERILALIEEKEHSKGAYSQFLECLEDDRDELHLGHSYIASLLQGTSFADEHIINASARFKKQMTGKYMLAVLSHVNAYELVPFLRSEKLLMLDELDKLGVLQKTRTNRAILLDLLKLLDTKGPTAHCIFVYCLREETSHPAHKELFDMLSSGEASADSSYERLKRKRKVEIVKADAASLVKVTKRDPDRDQIEGGLTTKTYFEAMKKIRKLHLSGKWEEADVVAEEAMAKNGVDIQVAVLLESCTGLITRRQKDKVLEIVSEARELCSQITTNVPQLRGRCEWVLAKLFRYMNEKDKAREHIRNAMEIQFNIEAGEDTALTNYCYASILLESLAERFSSVEAAMARKRLERAIEHASIDDYGLDLSHPKIRLAQLYLGSSPFQPGMNDDPESIRKAGSCLEGVEVAALAPRTECIFYFTQSDLYRNAKEIPNAIHSAQQALDIARRKSLETEIISVTARFRSLHITPDSDSSSPTEE